MRIFVAAIGLPVCALCLHLSAAQSPSRIPQESVAAAPAAGEWQLTPLLAKGAPAPETSGQFQEFGEVYVLENALVFWARFGPGDKDWGLFTLKEGKVSKVFLQDVPFDAPDGRKLKFNVYSPALLHAGKRMLYISMDYPDHVYGWDGERLVRVLCAGDQLEVSGVRYTIKKAAVFNVDSEGRALLHYDANQPQHLKGWVIHDGTSFTPLWKEGDTLPGMPGVQIKNLSAGHICNSNCVKEARLLEDGSVLAFLEVTGAPYKKALFHIARDKTETLITDERKGGGSLDAKLQAAVKKFLVEVIGLLGATGEEFSMRELLATRSDSFVLSMTSYRVQVKSKTGSTWTPLLPLLFYDQGQTRVAFVEPREFEGMPQHWYEKPELELLFDRAMFLAPDSGRLLVTLKVNQTKDDFWKSKRVDISFPGLYFWDGEKLSNIPWETALGMDSATVLKSLQTERKHGWSAPAEPKVIGLWRINGPVSGLGVLLPVTGPTGPQWFVGSNSATGQLEQSPRFQVPGRAVSVANIVRWRNPEEIVVELEDGLFLLTKTGHAN